jgi:hypothetical protein
LPHCGHFSPPGQSCFGSFGLHLIGGPAPAAASAVSIRRWALPPPLLLPSPSVIWHSMLVRLPFVPAGWGRVVTASGVMAVLLQTFFLASEALKLPSVDHSVPLDFTVLASTSALAVDKPSLQVVVVGSPGSGPSGTEGGGPGAAPTAVTRHFHLNGKPTGIWAAAESSPPMRTPLSSDATFAAWLSACGPVGLGAATHLVRHTAAARVSRIRSSDERVKPTKATRSSGLGGWDAGSSPTDSSRCCDGGVTRQLLLYFF